MALLGLVIGPVFTLVWAYTGQAVALMLMGVGLTWIGCSFFVAVFAPWVPGKRPVDPPDNSGATVQP